MTVKALLEALLVEEVTDEPNRATEDEQAVEGTDLRRQSQLPLRDSTAKGRTFMYSSASSAVNAPEYLRRSQKQTA